MKNTAFRSWLRNMWIDNCEEHALYHTIPHTSLKVYFDTYKYWLKREFKRQTQI